MPSNRGIPTSENDLMQMQQDAVRRVREMQERSRIAVDNANQSLNPVIRQEERAHQHNREPENIEHNIQEKHNEPPKRDLNASHNPNIHKKTINKILPFDFPLSSLTDSLTYEDFLLVGLIILLITEEADEMIILALVYILVTELDFFGK